MPWFYCPQLAVSLPSDTHTLAEPIAVSLPEDESNHARKVLRLKAGAEAVLFDGSGLVGRGAFTRVAKQSEVAVASVERVAQPQPAVEIATAIPKGSKADDMIPQLSQLGVTKVIPLTSERSVVDPRPNKLDRFARSAVESAKQCQRAHVMSVTDTVAFGKLLTAQPQPDLTLLAAAPRDGGAPLPDLAHRIRQAKTVRVYVGPEGGWSEEELDQARAAGVVLWTFSPNVLRIETAAVAAAANLAYAAM